MLLKKKRNKMNKSLLIFALHVIQEECLRYSCCDERWPFYIEEGCGIQDNPPGDWDILKEDPVEEKLLY